MSDSYWSNPKKINPEIDLQRESTRRDFIEEGFRSLMGHFIKSSEKALEPFTKRPFIRPPGAQVEALFLALCTRCDACTMACPHEAISVHYGSGESVDGTPVMANLRNSPCLMCEDIPCIPACPTDALLSLESVEMMNVGTAVLDRLSCTAYRGSKCSTCYDVCPIKDEAINLLEGLPLINEDLCTGCGICQKHCPEEPEAIKVFPQLFAD